MVAIIGECARVVYRIGHVHPFDKHLGFPVGTNAAEGTVGYVVYDAVHIMIGAAIGDAIHGVETGMKGEGNGDVALLRVGAELIKLPL